MFHVVAGPHQSERLATIGSPDGAMFGNDIAVVVPLGIR